MHRPGDDDSSAVTFWGKADLYDVLKKALGLLDEHYAERERRYIAAVKGEPGPAQGWRGGEAVTSIPKLDYAANLRRSFARAKAAAIMSDLDKCPKREREYLLALLLDAVIQEYGNGLEKTINWLSDLQVEKAALELPKSILIHPKSSPTGQD